MPEDKFLANFEAYFINELYDHSGPTPEIPKGFKAPLEILFENNTRQTKNEEEINGQKESRILFVGSKEDFHLMWDSNSENKRDFDTYRFRLKAYFEDRIKVKVELLSTDSNIGNGVNIDTFHLGLDQFTMDGKPELIILLSELEEEKRKTLCECITPTTTIINFHHHNNVIFEDIDLSARKVISVNFTPGSPHAETFQNTIRAMFRDASQGINIDDVISTLKDPPPRMKNINAQYWTKNFSLHNEHIPCDIKPIPLVEITCRDFEIVKPRSANPQVSIEEFAIAEKSEPPITLNQWIDETNALNCEIHGTPLMNFIVNIHFCDGLPPKARENDSRDRLGEMPISPRTFFFGIPGKDDTNIAPYTRYEEFKKSDDIQKEYYQTVFKAYEHLPLGTISTCEDCNGHTTLVAHPKMWRIRHDGFKKLQKKGVEASMEYNELWKLRVEFRKNKSKLIGGF